jgi:hypothetical protein
MALAATADKDLIQKMSNSAKENLNRIKKEDEQIKQ